MGVVAARGAGGVAPAWVAFRRVVVTAEMKSAASAGPGPALSREYTCTVTGRGPALLRTRTVTGRGPALLRTRTVTGRGPALLRTRTVTGRGPALSRTRTVTGRGPALLRTRTVT